MSNKPEKEKDHWLLKRIIEALYFLGGKGTLKEIYKYIGENHKQNLTEYVDWTSAIRSQIYTHSSDTSKFRGKTGDANDLFYAMQGKGKGIWGLRSHTK